jgi:UDP-N-acetylmuramate dehydrogenase
MERDDVILGGTFRLQKSEESVIAAREKRWLRKRAHLPKGKSMGCVFKNPPNVSAGELIDRTGLKGLRIGGAKISEEHANFIINDGKATARQIETLIGIIKNAVFCQYGVTLQEEIRYIT